MKRTLRILTGTMLCAVLVLSCTVNTCAEGTEASPPQDSSADASYFLDANNVQYVLLDGRYVPCAMSASGFSGGAVQPAATGYGESSASWQYSKTDNGYTVQHKGWKERQSSSSLYGVRACCKTVCSPAKQFWTRASMTNALGHAYTSKTTSGSGGMLTARSDYYNVHIENACMRSTWGGIGTVVSRW